MPPIKVLCADDSSLIRNIIQSTLMQDPSFELLGVAPDGQRLLDALCKHKPDVIVLDVIMPNMDGLEVLKEIRKTDKTTPIIMFSSMTEDRSKSYTVRALTLGATDFAAKPMSLGGERLTAKDALEQLKAKIQAVHQGARKGKRPQSPSTNRIKQTAPIGHSHYQLIVIGSSTGGPEALKTALNGLSPPMPPICITQHMPASFTEILANNLDKVSQLKVLEAKTGMPLQKNHVYVAPGDFHMTIQKIDQQMQIVLDQSPPVNSCRPAVDRLFYSVAEHFKGKTLAMILTGMGQDGLDGCKRLKGDLGATIVCQNKETSVVWGMPAAIHEAQIEDMCLPITEINSLLRRCALHGDATV